MSYGAIICGCIIGREVTMTVHIKTRVLPGNRIEISAAGLSEGQDVDVAITPVDDKKSPLAAGSILEFGLRYRRGRGQHAYSGKTSNSNSGRSVILGIADPAPIRRRVFGCADTSSILLRNIRVMPHICEFSGKRLTDARSKLRSSELILLETLVLPMRNHDQQLQKDYERILLNPSFHLTPGDPRSCMKLCASVRSNAI